MQNFQEHLFCEIPGNRCFCILLYLYIHKALLVASRVITILLPVSTCTNHCHDKNVSHIFIHLVSCAAQTQTRWECVDNIHLYKNFYGERKAYSYIFKENPACIFWIDWTFWNMCSISITNNWFLFSSNNALES